MITIFILENTLRVYNPRWDTVFIWEWEPSIMHGFFGLGVIKSNMFLV